MAEIDRLLTAEEVAERLGYTVRYVWRLGREGALERVKPPGRKYVRFPESGVQRYIESGRVQPLRLGAAVEVVEVELPSPVPRRRRRFGRR